MDFYYGMIFIVQVAFNKTFITTKVQLKLRADKANPSWSGVLL